MKSNKHIIKKLFSEEKIGNRINKKLNKPWVMQYKWNSTEDWDKHSWMKWGGYKEDWQDHYDKYMNIDHALQMLNKEMRSYSREKWAGRTIRLFNKEANQIQELIIVNNKLILLT